MAELTYTEADMQRVAERMNRLSGELDEEDRILLVAVFELAAEALEARRGAEVSGYSQPLSSAPGIVVTTQDGPVPTLGDSFVAIQGKPHPQQPVVYMSTP
jgi:hypothetical protein